MIEARLTDRIRNALRPVVKPMARTGKQVLKDLLVKLLVKVDKSFLVTAKPKSTWWNETHKSDLTDEPAHSINKLNSSRQMSSTAIVINEGSVIYNSEILRLLFETAFEKSDFSKLETQIFEHILSDTTYWSSYDKAIEAAKSLLLKREVNAEQGALVKKLEKHQERTRKNKLAYSLEDKTNPNTVFWPDPTMKKRARSVFDETPYAKTYNFLKKDTPIGSAGSCFAIEIAHKLQAEGYNYLVTEPFLIEGQKYFNANAKWGTIFNTPSFRQLVERAFGEASTPKLLWTNEIGGRLRYLDPFREDVLFDSIEEYEKDYDLHIAKCKEALLKTKVFVITLGVNEVWSLKATGHVFSRSPWQMASNLVEHHVLSVKQNVSELQRMIDLWRVHNPDLKLIVSVSPVPLHATFRGQTAHVMEANSLSKATLRVAAEEFVKANKDVFYFPSYESVLYATQSPWEKDQRHVSREAVAKVMALFDKMFLA